MVATVEPTKPQSAAAKEWALGASVRVASIVVILGGGVELSVPASLMKRRRFEMMSRMFRGRSKCAAARGRPEAVLAASRGSRSCA